MEFWVEFGSLGGVWDEFVSLRVLEFGSMGVCEFFSLGAWREFGGSLAGVWREFGRI